MGGFIILNSNFISDSKGIFKVSYFLKRDGVTAWSNLRIIMLHERSQAKNVHTFTIL